MKYRLIKEYPGSHELGTIVEKHGNNSIAFTYSSKTIYISSSEANFFEKLIVNQPEFWEEVVEKDYKILSFKQDSLCEDLWTEFSHGWCRNSNGNPVTDSYSYDEILNNHLNGGIKYRIHSVKRLSDGEVFTIGDIINTKVDNKYKQEIIEINLGINDNFLKDKLTFKTKAGYVVINIAVKSKQPLFTKVVEKDYEILSFKTGSGKLSLLQSNGNYFVEDNSDHIKFNPDGYFKGCTVEEELKYESEIHSVKRLSDGEVFTVGDNIIGFNNIIAKINSINLVREVSLIINSDTHEGFSLKNLKKSKLPLFTTEDGVDIFKGDEVTWLFSDNSSIAGTRKAETTMYTSLKYFSTKEKAEEYILLNKPCLSISDILKLQNRWSVKTIDKLKELVKNK